MLDTNLSNNLDQDFRNQIIKNLKVIDSTLTNILNDNTHGDQVITKQQLEDTLLGLRNIVYTVSAGSDKGDSTVETQMARTSTSGKTYDRFGGRLDSIERSIVQLGGKLDV